MSRRLSYADAAAFLGLPEGSLRSMVSRRLVPHLRLAPRTVRFDEAELTRWLETKRQAAVTSGAIQAARKQRRAA